MNYKNSYLYIGMHSLLFGLGLPLLIKIVGSDFWISALIGIIFNIIFLLLFNNHKYSKTLTVIISIILIMLYLISFGTYITNFYLKNASLNQIILITFLLVIYIVNKGHIVITRVSFITMLFNILLFIFMVISLINKVDFYNYLPIMSNNILTILKGSVIYFLVTIIPYLNINNNLTLKNNLILLLISSLFTLIILGLTLGVVGPNFIKIYRFPEYMMLKEIRLFSFVANVENIIAFIWGNELIINLIIHLENIKNNTSTLIYKIITGGILIIIIFNIVTNPNMITFIKINLIYILITILILLTISKQFFKNRNCPSRSINH